MNCKDAMEQIIAQSNRQAPAPELENHLFGCSACSKVYLEQRALWRQMDAWEAPEISAGFDRGLFARIGNRAAQPWFALDWLLRLLRPLQPSFAVALACMLVIAGVVVERGRQIPVPVDTVVTTQTLEVDDPQQIERALDDMQMLSEFEILPLGQVAGGRS